MNTVQELRKVLSDEVRRLQPPSGLEARVLQQALRDSTALDAVRGAGRHGARRHWDATSIQSPRLAALLAALIALAIVVSLVFAARALNRTPAPVKPVPNHGVATGKPIPVSPPATMDCPASCITGTLTLASPDVIWAIVETSEPSGPTAPGPANIYRSPDRGQTWVAQASWQNPVPAAAIDHLTVSSDGRQALFVDAAGLTVFHTGDGGAHWESSGLPLSVDPTAMQTYFLTPREGWLVSPDTVAHVDDLFHTTDSGAHWLLSGRVATSAGFDLVHGRLVYQSALSAWFVPDYSGSPAITQTIYHSLDGGLSWRAMTLRALPVTTEPGKPDQTVPVHAAITALSFFGDEGLISIQSVFESGFSPDGQRYYSCCDQYGPTAVYLTSDAGATWSAPRLIPSAGAIDFVDASHWVEYGFVGGGNSFARTSDAGKSWENVKPVLNNVPARDPQRGLKAIQFVDPLNALAWITCPAILITTSDGGSHWAPLSVPSNQPVGTGGCSL